MKFPPELTKEKNIQAAIFLSTLPLGEVSKINFKTNTNLENYLHWYGTDVLYPF